MKRENISNRIAILIVSGLCVFYFLFLLNFFAPAISTPDAQGYFTQGRIIATQGRTFLVPENNLQYIGPHWHSQDGKKYYTTFPPGLPCLIAIGYKLFGANSTFLVNLILATLSLLLFFLLCRTWLSSIWALVATFFLSINPFYNEHALFGDSHISVIFFFLLGLLFLIKAVKRENYVYAFISGIAMGVIPTIRYAEFILCIVFGAYILWLFYKKRIPLKIFISFLIGILGPLIMLAVRNYLAFGKPWMTGYSLASSQALFGINYLVKHFIPFVIMLVTSGMGILFLFSIGGFIKILKNQDTRAIGTYYLSSVIILTFLYMGYSWRVDPQAMRFLLPTFPLYTFTAVYFISHLNRKYKIAFLSIALLVSLPWGVFSSLRAVKPLYVKNRILAEITEAVEKRIEDGSIIITYEGICQNLDLYGRWKLVDISILSKANVLPFRRPIKPIRNKYAENVYNPLYGEEFKEQLIKDLNQWSAKRIYIIAYENEIEVLGRLLEDRFNIDKRGFIEISHLKELKFILKRGMPHRPRIKPPPGPGGPNRIFDFEIREEPLIIAELGVK